MFGVITFSERGESGQPSPSIWGSSPRSLLNDQGTGFFVSQQFVDVLAADLPGLPEDGDSATYAYNDGTQGNRMLNITTGSTDNNAAAISTRPLGRIRRNAGDTERLWFETEIAVAALTDQAVFAGVAELAALDRDVVADNPGNAAQAGLATESMVGFVSQQVGSATTKLDAVLRKDDGTVVTVLSDVTNASALNAQTGANGEQLQADLRGDLTANGLVKLGLKFDGNRNMIDFYVQGVKVASYEVDSTVDQAKEYGGIVAVKTGAAAARTIRVNFLQAAAQVRA